ncbi:MAG: ABC transporter ATP-binding protein [Aquamicrobium sp.]|uniref:ABC transporter ATP-binding protein n=1 Tax=Mesorhizobium sp. Pch-S TaxID=2082387 RepID=UPI0010113F62|nr:ABC transporter ATP-binding protein [Mesorhizobium sp. Pch-S]MBR2688268.1 ABC transporter ATP-binding protein [Aquamicrobium sp.]QAZ44313.1 ABC transporter ATP-binding protein [Mesorhizobium sp. Pch-S]
MTGPLVSIRDLSVSYRRDTASFSLRNVDLDIAPGERLAIIGESGSGKSTLALAIAGLLPPTATVDGAILWSGQPQLSRGGRDIGFVFQDASASLDPVMAVGRQIAEVARTHLDLSWAQARDRALDLLRRVRLPDPDTALHAYPHQLSGGQRQRVAIATAIAAGPRLLIADEATSALDTIVQADIVALIRQLVAEDAMALLFVSHDIALAAEQADRIAVFDSGEMVELGTADAVIQKPRHAYTRKLLDAHIGLDATPMIIATERGHV